MRVRTVGMNVSRMGSVCFAGYFALLVVFGGAPVHAAASQTAMATPVAEPLRFETVSIRPHTFTGNDPSNRQVLPGGRFVASATTVRTLIRIAFGTDDDRMVGAPKWIDDESFDIYGVIENRAAVNSPEQFQQLMLSLLEERFGFRFHREKKDGPVYWLRVDKPGKLGPGLKPGVAGSQPNMSVNSNGQVTTMKATNMTMADVASALRRQAGRPVEDHTGLTGTYGFEIAWSPDETAESAQPALPTVLKEQLGLKLQAAKGTTENIVIDQIGQPTAN